jgi:hypothetical protein
VHHRVAARHGRVGRRGVADISSYKFVFGILFNGSQVGQVPRIRQLVVIYDRISAVLRKHQPDEIRADEACSTGDKKFHRPPTSVPSRESRLRLFMCISTAKVMARNSSLDVAVSIRMAKIK